MSVFPFYGFSVEITKRPVCEMKDQPFRRKALFFRPVKAVYAILAVLAVPDDEVSVIGEVRADLCVFPGNEPDLEQARARRFLSTFYTAFLSLPLPLRDGP